MLKISRDVLRGEERERKPLLIKVFLQVPIPSAPTCHRLEKLYDNQGGIVLGHKISKSGIEVDSRLRLKLLQCSLTRRTMSKASVVSWAHCRILRRDYRWVLPPLNEFDFDVVDTKGAFGEPRADSILSRLREILTWNELDPKEDMKNKDNDDEKPEMKMKHKREKECDDNDDDDKKRVDKEPKKKKLKKEKDDEKRANEELKMKKVRKEKDDETKKKLKKEKDDEKRDSEEPNKRNSRRRKTKITIKKRVDEEPKKKKKKDKQKMKKKKIKKHLCKCNRAAREAWEKAYKRVL
ncbi:hypothetical protein Tco_1393204 [Tanacetum coccineum]